MTKKTNIILKFVICLLLVLSILVSAVAFSCNAIAEPNSGHNNISKFDDDLVEVLDCLSDDDSVDVVIWFYDAPKSVKRTYLSKQLQDSESDYLKRCPVVGDLTELDTNAIKSMDDYNQYYDVFRESRKAVFEYYNEKVLNEIITNNEINPKILYLSIYSPTVQLSITKADLIRIQYDEHIQSISYYEDIPFYDEVDDYTNNTSDRIEIENRSYPYGYWQYSTNIRVLREVHGLSGEGVNIGLLEAYGVPNTQLPVFSYCVNNNRMTILDNPEIVDGHANKMAAVLVGKTSDYYGVAYNAHLFCTGKITASNFISKMNNLINNNVKIINMSLDVTWGTIYNSFGKFMDYVVSNYGITICKSAGNFRVIYGDGFSYDSITVGCIDDKNNESLSDDIRWDDGQNSDQGSGYYDGYNYAYKPDLSAPGENAKTPYDTVGFSGATSRSTAIVSGVCALLMEQSIAVKNNPMLLKSILLATAYNLQSMTDVYSNSSDIYPALDRELGAGMIDAYAAYSAIYNNRFVDISSDVDKSSAYNSISITMYPMDIVREKDIFASVCWMQAVTYPNNSPNLVVAKHHELRLYDPNNVLVAKSSYTNDRKQFIRYKPTVDGVYTLMVVKTGNTDYKAQAGISYSKYNEYW